MLVHFLHRDRGKPPRGAFVVFHRATALKLRGDAAVRQNPGEAADRVRAAAEAEQEDAVARPPETDEHFIAVDDIRGQAEAGRLAQEVVSHAEQSLDDAAARRP